MNERKATIVFVIAMVLIFIIYSMLSLEISNKNEYISYSFGIFIGIIEGIFFYKFLNEDEE